MKFINDDFMLHGETAKKLYHDFAKDMPIIDYHCHLPIKQIAENHQFRNAYDLFLGGDHYKWRQMRTNGIDEKYITGDSSWKDKFLKYAEALEVALGNPLYHWSHMELKQFFGINEPLTAETAEEIWDRANKVIKESRMSPRKLIKNSNVESLEYANNGVTIVQKDTKELKKCYL